MDKAKVIASKVERENETIARLFVQAWCNKDVEGICSLLAADVVYMIYEGGPVEHGVGAIRIRLNAFMKRWSKIDFKIGRFYGVGPLVIHERIEDYHGADGHPDWHFEVASMLVIKNGKIEIWRDYGSPGGRQSSPQA
jgi:limonene-1,2-epoxide hydrolase